MQLTYTSYVTVHRCKLNSRTGDGGVGGVEAVSGDNLRANNPHKLLGKPCLRGVF